MHLSTARVAPLDGRAEFDSELMYRLLWRCRSTIFRVEHLRVVPGQGYLRIGAFILATNQIESDEILRRLINLTLSSTTELRQWRLL
ncbi:hypothetical protein [Micromonospora mirobrigensis]|uniref:Uncharacterized protein n=1 Tax=Micromonospora mirobrigensis TaxID=262898 RepID=A0A1C5AH10_9ACTN|nr:hypothetical protein [Micromonospora mirobrigensis]SCF44351.1 hypothetical protein GA0070564_11074 [Micromonospora mirobrigensis]